MRVLFVTSEVAGMYKLGGLGDVSASLPVAMRDVGVDVVVAMPYYRDIKLNGSTPESLGTLSVPFDGKRELVFLYTTQLADTGVHVVLFRHPKLDQYHGPLMEERFSFFSQAVVMFYYYTLSHTKLRFDIVHCNDWHTALVPFLLGENNKVRKGKKTLNSSVAKTVLTIHNLLYQGETGVALAAKLGIDPSLFHPRQGTHGQYINLLREGLEYADVISTVSPTYAKEITSHAYGHGLEEVLARRKDRVVGIVNGIDRSGWDPAHDTFIARQYTAASVVEARRVNKADIQKEAGLQVSADIPLFSFIGRLEKRQKGVDLIVTAIERLFPETSAQIVILGTGSADVEEEVHHVARKYPGHVSFLNVFNETLAHKIYAGSDVILVPSKYEPCGLVQLIAMRYGCLPLARNTGGLADTIQDGKTGFLFTSYTPSALSESIFSLASQYTTKRDSWERMVKRAMKQNFSWSKSAAEYKSLYKTLITSSRRVDTGVAAHL